MNVSVSLTQEPLMENARNVRNVRIYDCACAGDGVDCVQESVGGGGGDRVQDSGGGGGRRRHRSDGDAEC
ncbi:Hypothetical predicted protein [Octopus vulgaris]|uniref:Uncharacterized protein n=1 Tax=Octopus vulgaris TaxID=6645 RepID=A0AA36AMV7_OCTVU|nr:Hypothetical predicted protein [Octopus vulgaris]